MSSMRQFLASPLGSRVTWGCRIALGLVFAFAALPKLMDPDAFAEAIFNYGLVSADTASLLALWLPVLELTVAFSLVTGVAARGSALLSLGMLCAFSVAIGQAAIRGIDIDCGCFGSQVETKVSVTSLLRNAGLCLLAGIGAAGPPGPLRRRQSPTP